MPPQPQATPSTEPAAEPTEADEDPAPLPPPAAPAVSAVEMAPAPRQLPTHRSVQSFASRGRDLNHLQPPSTSALSIQVDSAAGADSQPSSPASNSESPSLVEQGRHSPQWFGAAHYDQVDASFRKEAADVAVSRGDEKSANDIFARHKNRLGRATYLVAPSASSPAAVRHIQQHQQQTAAPDARAADGDDSGLHTAPAAIQSPEVAAAAADGLTRRHPPQTAEGASGGGPGKPTPPGADEAVKARMHVKLGEWPATAICANDITSSCFYAVSITTQSAGIWAPLCFLFVVFVLYLFRNVYGEAITALPLNGGAYNVLLNTTSKKVAAFAGCLSLLSYMATGVVSAASAISYLQYILSAIPSSAGVIVLLCFFASLALWGIKDSASLAYAILLVHMSSMAVLIVTMVVFLCRNPSEQQFANNVHSDVNPSVPRALLFGYASAMLGITGFETSANFVEEQQDGVFVKTLRNMWILVSILNPTLSLLAVLVLPLDAIVASDHVNVLLAYLGDVVGGAWLKYIVSIDAFLVLAAAVLTAYVGMNGLARRLALDRGLPQVLLSVNRWRQTNHWIIMGFLLICISLYFIVSGDTDSLGNVYSISFLLVMSGFAIGNMLLKYNRGQLKREVRASWSRVLLALTLVLLALGGVIGKDPSILAVWVVYFGIVLSAVGVMFFRVHLLQVAYYAAAHVSAYFHSTDNGLLRYIHATVLSFSQTRCIFFSKYGRLSVLNEAVLYLLANEEASHLSIVHLYQSEADIPSKLLRHVSVLDQEYNELTVELVLVKGVFDGQTVDWLSEQLQVSKNLMFLTCPKQDFKVKLAELGGVRLIAR